MKASMDSRMDVKTSLSVSERNTTATAIFPVLERKIVVFGVSSGDLRGRGVTHLDKPNVLEKPTTCTACIL